MQWNVLFAFSRPPPATRCDKITLDVAPRQGICMAVPVQQVKLALRKLPWLLCVSQKVVL